MAAPELTRREWLQTASAALAGAALAMDPGVARAEEKAGGLKIGMCDWSIGKRNAVGAFEVAKEIGLDGVEVSVGSVDGLYLREPKGQREYLRAAERSGVAIPSVAMGFLNHIPLFSEPKMALWLADSIDIAAKLGAKAILVAAFPPKGELKEENADDMRRVTEIMAELGPRAEKAGVALGLENYLSAEANLKIIEGAKSPAVQVYYDVYNSWVSKGHDPVKEIKLLGAKRICSVHLKEGRHLLGQGIESSKGTGQERVIDWPAIAATLKEIGYRGWIVLETSSPSGDLVKDTRANLEYVRKTFAGLTT